jgi:hypothetical protein
LSNVLLRRCVLPCALLTLPYTRLALQARAKQNERLIEVHRTVDELVRKGRQENKNAVSMNFSDPFYHDSENIRVLDASLRAKGYDVKRDGDEVVIRFSKEPIPALEDTQPHFEHRDPTASAAEQRKEHPVVLGTHSHSQATTSSSTTKVPLIKGISQQGEEQNRNLHDSTIDIHSMLQSKPEDVFMQLHPRSDSVSVRARAFAKIPREKTRLISRGQLNCSRCDLGFTLFRSPDQCGECSAIVCTKCSLNLPYLEVLLSQDSCVCNKCWDVVKVKLEVKEQSFAGQEKKAAMCRQEIEYGDRLLLQDPEERATPAERLLLSEAANSDGKVDFPPSEQLTKVIRLKQ